MRRLRALKIAYFLFMSFLALVVVATPFFIREGVSIFSEEALEGSLILFLLVTGSVIDFFYVRETRRSDKALQEAWRHIGAVNLLVDRLRVALTDDEEYPRTRKELQSFAATVMEKVRGLVSCEFLMMRVVDTETLKTVFEFSENHLPDGAKMPKIGNKELIQGRTADGLDVVCSQSGAMKIRAFLVFSRTGLEADRRLVIQKLVNDFSMVHAISAYILR